MERIENTNWSMGEIDEYYLVRSDDTHLLMTKTEIELATERAERLKDLIPEEDKPFWKFWDNDEG